MKTLKHWFLVAVFLFDSFGCLYLFVERQLNRVEGGAVRAAVSKVSNRFSSELVAHWKDHHPGGGYVKDVHDCDDFAIEYYASLRASGYRAGFVLSYSAAHAWNCVKAPDGRLVYIEPQNGRFYLRVPNDVIILWEPEEVAAEWLCETLEEKKTIKKEKEERGPI